MNSPDETFNPLFRLPALAWALSPRTTWTAPFCSQKARNLQRDPRVAISLAPADNPFSPVVVRGRVVTWLSGDEGWAVVDAIAEKYIHAPYDRGQERVVGMIAVDHYRIGM